MSSLMIPGEPHLSQQLREAAARDALGHALILSGQGDLAAAAQFAAAALECESSDRPCGVCGACRKILRGIHPDLIQVTDPDHKNIAVEVLRNVVSDAYILPNEGRHKIYLFPDCGVLDPKAQNVLLKVLEDGPSYAAFLFCARNSSVLLNTIRSRAVEWKLSPPQEEAAADDSQARQLCELLCAGKAADLTGFCTDLENSKMSREDLKALLSDTRDLLTAGLTACYTGTGGKLACRLAKSLGRQKLAEKTDVLDRFIRQCNYNIGIGHLTGALAVALCG